MATASANEPDSKVNDMLHEERIANIFNPRFLLLTIANSSEGVITDTGILNGLLADPKRGPSLREELSKAWKEGRYQSIRDLPYLRTSITPSSSGGIEGKNKLTSDETTATEKAWSVPYVGKAAQTLCTRIKNFLPKAKYDDDRRHLYARYMMIVQSSGMGKSRMVDEMAKSEFVIPMVLRSGKATGYPPSDKGVVSYFTDTRSGMIYRVFAFLQALFEEVTLVLEGKSVEGLGALNKSKPLAAQFRACMNHHMSMFSHGDFRDKFYDQVIRKAGQISEVYEQRIPRAGDVTKPEMDMAIKDPTFPLNNACKNLLQAMDAFPHEKPSFIVLSLDEVHTLGDHFVVFRRALRALINQPVFTILLSTSGHMRGIIPNPTTDPSDRMAHTGRVVPPLSELGFDHFAKDVYASGNEVKLSHVSSTAQLVKFGRPLWVTRAALGEPGVQAQIIHFAASKLLCHNVSSLHHHSQLRVPQQLGCLAQRLPIDFLSVSHSSTTENSPAEQVRSHLRVIIRVDENLETMITFSPSEPILSEAAYSLMDKELIQPAQALKGILGGFSVGTGDRGELLVMLLLILARDVTVGHADEDGCPASGSRCCGVLDFLSKLFVKGPWEAAVERRKSSMQSLFGDCILHFNRFVKVHEYKMLDIKYIRRLMTRGAAILCATTQKGVDLVIPFNKGDVLSEATMGVILIQVKNDPKFTSKPKATYLEKMALSGLSKLPTLRLFFALAARTSGITAVETPAPNTSDFWVAGLSSAILKPIAAEGDAVWSGLLHASFRWNEIYKERGRRDKLDREALTDLRRATGPGCASLDAHWESWWPSRLDEGHGVKVPEAHDVEIPQTGGLEEEDSETDEMQGGHAADETDGSESGDSAADGVDIYEADSDEEMREDLEGDTEENVMELD